MQSPQNKSSVTHQLTMPRRASPTLTMPASPNTNTLTMPQWPTPTLTMPPSPATDSLTMPPSTNKSSLTMPPPTAPTLTMPRRASPELTMPQWPTPTLTMPPPPAPSANTHSLTMPPPAATPSLTASSTSKKRGPIDNSGDRSSKVMKYSDSSAAPSGDGFLGNLTRRNQELMELNSQLTAQFRKELAEMKEVLEEAKQEIGAARKHEAQMQGEIYLLKKPQSRSAKDKALREANAQVSELEKQVEKLTDDNYRLKLSLLKEERVSKQMREL
ncbi:hypothetical protein F5Y13DRAFT_188066 [Hypoxylon sp. FL1857]|nr:hypothetical protein F5Y13DRAFT_188066 [Hypoxylon sp. FL1857]